MHRSEAPTHFRNIIGPLHLSCPTIDLQLACATALGDSKNRIALLVSFRYDANFCSIVVVEREVVAAAAERGVVAAIVTTVTTATSPTSRRSTRRWSATITSSSTFLRGRRPSSGRHFAVSCPTASVFAAPRGKFPSPGRKC